MRFLSRVVLCGLVTLSVPSAFVSVSASPTGTAAVGPALYHGSPLSGDLGCFKDGYHSLPWNKDGRNWIEQPYQYSLCLYSARAANAPFFGLRTPFCYYGTFDLRTLGASDQCSYTSQTADGVSGVGSYPGDPSGSTIYQDGWIRLFNTSQAQDLDLITTPTPTLTPTPTPTLPPVPTIQPNPSSCGIKRGDKVWTGYAAHVFQTKADCEIVTSGTSETCQETSFIPYGSATNYDSCGLETGDQVGIGCWLVYQTYSDYLLQCNNGGGAGTWVAAGDGQYIRYQLDRTPKKSSNPNTCGIKRGDLVWTGYAAHVFQTKADCEIVTNGTLETCQETRFIPHGSVTDYNSCGLQTGDKVGIGCWLVYQTYQDYWDQCRNGGGAGTWVGAGDGAYIRYQLAHLPKITSNPNTCNITHVYTGYAAHVFQRLADCDRVTAPYVLKTNERCSKTPLVPHEGNTCGLLTGDETGIGCWYAYQTYDDYWNQCRNGGGKGTWVGRGDGAYIQAKINGKPTGSAAYINSIDSASTLGVADTTCTSSPSSISPAIIGGVVGAMVVVMILSHIAHYQVQKRRQQNSVKSITVPMEYTNNPITTQV